MNLINRIEHTPITELVPYAGNARTHSEDQVAQIAASIKEFGFNSPVLIDKDNGIIAGHGRVMAAMKLGLDLVPTVTLDHLSDAERRAYILADNRLALNAGWDEAILASELQRLESEIDLHLLGFDDNELTALLNSQELEPMTDEDAVPDAPENPVTVEGDVWLLGRHRLMCGDSTSIDAVQRLMNGNKAALIHADPPYGMGKEGDGVANDNLYKKKLDQFQMDWWNTCRIFAENNGSAYIWGNSEDLWRLWYSGGLSTSEGLTFRNDILWHQEGVSWGKDGMGNLRQFANMGEHCLFFMLGEQGFNNNADNYWVGWDSLRLYLVTEKEKSGLTNEQIKTATSSTHTHYWTTSQWAFPTKDNYEAIQALAQGKHFMRKYDDLKKEYDHLKGNFNDSRAYFDSGHDKMSDVWRFDRVRGKDRHGHATPKPVAMMERVMLSSLPKRGVCLEPFAGSGTTLISAEKTGRICFTMELMPDHCDVIIKRWQDYTGQQATHEVSGKTFDEVANVSEEIRASTAA